MSLESPYSSLLSGSCTTGTTLSGAACAITAATTPPSRAPAGSGTQVSSFAGAPGADSSATPSTPALGGLRTRVSTPIWLAGRSCAPPTSFPFSCDWPGGAIRVVPTGPDFDVRPGGVICAAPVDLPLGVSLSGCYSAALASVAPALQRLSLLGLLGPSSHRLLELRGLLHNVNDG